MSGGVLEARDATGLAFDGRMTGVPGHSGARYDPVASWNQPEAAGICCRGGRPRLWAKRQTGCRTGCLAAGTACGNCLSGWSCPDAPFRKPSDSRPDKVKRLEAGSRQGASIEAFVAASPNSDCVSVCHASKATQSCTATSPLPRSSHPVKNETTKHGHDFHPAQQKTRRNRKRADKG